MPLTDRSDVYIALNEHAVNTCVLHVMRQWPSLFNIGSGVFVANPSLMPAPIDVAPMVLAKNNPIVMDSPFKMPLGGGNIDYGLQLNVAKIDLHPGNAISLPPELNPPLGQQRLALQVRACGDALCRIGRRSPTQEGRRGSGFCLDVFATGHLNRASEPTGDFITGAIDGIEIVDLKPTGLENFIECFALGYLSSLLSAYPLTIPDLTVEKPGMTKVTPRLIPASAEFPNPAIEDDQIKAYVNLEVGNPPPAGPPDTGGGSGQPPAPKPVYFTRSRVRTGPYDATIAVSEAAVQKLFASVVDNFKGTFSASKTLSTPVSDFTGSVSAAFHLKGGTIDLANGEVQIAELDLKWDKLELGLIVDIPEICVGGGCIDLLLTEICLPKICVFSDPNEIDVTLDLFSFIKPTTEVSVHAKPAVKYGIYPQRTPAMSYLDAEDAKIPNGWQVFIDPSWIDLDVIDIADTVGDLLQSLVDSAIENLLSWLPGWAIDAIQAITGAFIDLVRWVLDIPDDIAEWIYNLVFIDLDLKNYIVKWIYDQFIGAVPVFGLEDPYPAVTHETIVKLSGQIQPPALADHLKTLIPLKIPIEYMGIAVEDREMIAGLDIGGYL